MKLNDNSLASGMTSFHSGSLLIYLYDQQIHVIHHLGIEFQERCRGLFDAIPLALVDLNCVCGMFLRMKLCLGRIKGSPKISMSNKHRHQPSHAAIRCNYFVPEDRIRDPADSISHGKIYDASIEIRPERIQVNSIWKWIDQLPCNGGDDSRVHDENFFAETLQVIPDLFCLSLALSLNRLLVQTERDDYCNRYAHDRADGLHPCRSICGIKGRESAQQYRTEPNDHKRQDNYVTSTINKPTHRSPVLFEGILA